MNKYAGCSEMTPTFKRLNGSNETLLTLRKASTSTWDLLIIMSNYTGFTRCINDFTTSLMDLQKSILKSQ